MMQNKEKDSDMSGLESSNRIHLKEMETASYKDPQWKDLTGGQRPPLRPVDHNELN